MLFKSLVDSKGNLSTMCLAPVKNMAFKMLIDLNIILNDPNLKFTQDLDIGYFNNDNNVDEKNIEMLLRNLYIKINNAFKENLIFLI